jgi:hypothetical protein
MVIKANSPGSVKRAASEQPIFITLGKLLAAPGTRKRNVIHAKFVPVLESDRLVSLIEIRLSPPQMLPYNDCCPS